MSKDSIMQLYSFISELILISVLVKIIILLNNTYKIVTTSEQLSIKLISGSLAFIIITATIGAIKYLGIHNTDSINLPYLHDLFSLWSKQLAMPIAVVFIVKNTIATPSSQHNKIQALVLKILLLLCLTSFTLVALLSLPVALYKLVDITLVVSSMLLIVHALKNTQGILHASGALLCLIIMAILPTFFSTDSQLYITSLHLFLASYLYLLAVGK